MLKSILCIYCSEGHRKYDSIVYIRFIVYVFIYLRKYM